MVNSCNCFYWIIRNPQTLLFSKNSKEPSDLIKLLIKHSWTILGLGEKGLNPCSKKTLSHFYSLAFLFNCVTNIVLIIKICRVCYRQMLKKYHPIFLTVFWCICRDWLIQTENTNSNPIHDDIMWIGSIGKWINHIHDITEFRCWKPSLSKINPAKTKENIFASCEPITQIMWLRLK